ncbi:MAG: carbohydrate porin [Endomicrobium sp.]|jgi:carbohydrate-selective porin OprB|nr:carbohydrate porin [Endomicrobium sp.]
MKNIIRILTLIFIITTAKQSFVLANDISLHNFFQYKVDGGTTFTYYCMPQLNSNYLIYSFDIKFIKLLNHSSKIILCLEGTGNVVYAYTNINDIVKLQNRCLNLKISKLFYETILCHNRITVTVGKIGFFSYFAKNAYAGNETTQFITGMFSKDQLVDVPKEPCAVRTNYVLSKKINLDYAYYLSELNSLNALQGTYTDTTTNYRIYSWRSNYININGKQHYLYGYGTSIDKTINEKFGIFYRFCHKNSDTIKQQGFCKLPVSHLWSIGAQFKNRVHDVLGLAIGKIYVDNKKLSYNALIAIPYANNITATQIELYYNFKLNNSIHISPIIQSFVKQAHKNTNTLFVYGIRTRISF